MIKKILIVIGIIILIIVISQVVNAAKYKMTVNVVEGENVLGVNPTTEKLDFGDLSRNGGMTRYVNLSSGGNTSVYVTAIKFGSISDLVDISNNNFVLEPGKETKLAFDIYIPPSAETKTYSGWVWIFRIPKLF